MSEDGLLASTDRKREVLTVRRVLEGHRRSVLHLHTHLLHSRPDQPDHEEENTEKSSISGGRVGENSPSDPTTNPTTRPDQPDHGHNPTTDPTTVNPCQPTGNGGVVGLVGSEREDDGLPGINPLAAVRGKQGGERMLELAAEFAEIVRRQIALLLAE